MFFLGISVFSASSMFRWRPTTTTIISILVAVPSTLYSVVLYLDWLPTDFIILGTLRNIFPIVLQKGSEIMFHTNATRVTKDMISPVVVAVFYVLYFVWFYLGFRSAENLSFTRGLRTRTLKPTIVGLDTKIIGLVLVVLGGLLLLYGLVIPTTGWGSPPVQFIFSVVGIYVALAGVFTTTYFPKPNGITKQGDFDTVVIGSGFGGTITSLAQAANYKEIAKTENVCILERGTWWVTPEDPGKPLVKFFREQDMPYQYWARPDNEVGFLNLIENFVRRSSDIEGLYEYRMFQDIDVLISSGVGGGSLIYTNVTIEPDTDVQDAWPQFSSQQRNSTLLEPYFKMASKFIGVNKIISKQAGQGPPPTHVDTAIPAGDWMLDRPRVLHDGFLQAQKEIGVDERMNFDYADLSITELPAEIRDANDQPIPGTNFWGWEEPLTQSSSISDAKTKQSINFCQRQGRCVLGCLPGARHTLNKKIFLAITKSDLPIKVRALHEVYDIRPVSDGKDGYDVHFINHQDATQGFVHCKKLVIAAGSLGSTELLLKCKANGHLDKISNRLGEQFSTDGDYFGFIMPTKETVNSARGPMVSSEIRFFKNGRFVFMIEDVGIPKMLANFFVSALELSKGLRKLELRWRDYFRSLTFLRLFIKRRDVERFRIIIKKYWADIGPGAFAQWLSEISRLGLFRKIAMGDPNATVHPNAYPTEDERVSKVFLFICMGLDRGNGRLGLKNGKLALDWVKRPGMANPDKPSIEEDPIFAEIARGARLLAKHMGQDEERSLIPVWDVLGLKRPFVVHPLGGCPIGSNDKEGVVDSFGRVYNYENLYVADGSIIPTALGVNPSKTISALAFRVAEKITEKSSIDQVESLFAGHGLL